VQWNKLPLCESVGFTAQLLVPGQDYGVLATLVIDRLVFAR